MWCCGSVWRAAMMQRWQMHYKRISTRGRQPTWQQIYLRQNALSQHPVTYRKGEEMRAEVSSTLPAVIAHAQLFPSEVTVAVIGAATVVPAVRDVTGRTLPVLIAFTIHTARYRVPRGALPVARAVIWTWVDSVEGEMKKKVAKSKQGELSTEKPEIAEGITNRTKPVITLRIKHPQRR